MPTSTAAPSSSPSAAATTLPVVSAPVAISPIPYADVESQLRRLQGEVLSQLESMGLPEKQCEAAKNVIRQQFSSRMWTLRGIGAARGVHGQLASGGDRDNER